MIREKHAMDQKFADLEQVMKRNEKILKKHMAENQQLKRTTKINENSSFINSTQPSSPSKPIAEKRDLASLRAQRKENA